MSNNKDILIREASKEDTIFMMSLSPTLADVAGLDWHDGETILKFQDNYIQHNLENQDVINITLIAELKGTNVGFIHLREHKDEISEQICATMPLLAVSPGFQGAGIGQKLLEAAFRWCQEKSYPMLHLEVFANNSKAQRFYEKAGFQAETLTMVKSFSENTE